MGVYVRVPERELAELRRQAAHLDVPVARLIRMIVHRGLQGPIGTWANLATEREQP